MAKPIDGPYKLGRKTKTQTAQFINAVRHTEFARVIIRMEDDSEHVPYTAQLRATAKLLAASYDLYELAKEMACLADRAELSDKATEILNTIHGE